MTRQGADSPDPEHAWSIRPGAVLLPTGEFRDDMEVVVAGRTIEAVVPRTESPLPPDRVIDAPEATLLPGLIDSHVHLTFSADTQVVQHLTSDSVALQVARAAGNAQKALARGVTTIVDCGGQAEVLLALRHGLQSRTILGPRLLVAGAPITTTAGHCHWLGGTADSLDDVIRLARTQVARGVDLIKIMMTGGNITAGSNPARLQYPPETVAALAAECERIGKPLVCHAHTTESVALAVAVGARIIAHATCSAPDGVIRISDELLEHLLGGSSFVDPTLTVGSDNGVPEPAPQRTQQRAAMVPVLRRLADAGVPLLAGTDSGVPGVAHGSGPEAVLALHHEVGLPLGQALLAATSVPARALGLDEEIGAIRPGLAADLLLVSGRVEDDPTALRRPWSVWREGALVARDGRLQVGTAGAEDRATVATR